MENNDIISIVNKMIDDKFKEQKPELDRALSVVDLYNKIFEKVEYCYRRISDTSNETIDSLSSKLNYYKENTDNLIQMLKANLMQCQQIIKDFPTEQINKEIHKELNIYTKHVLDRMQKLEKYIKEEKFHNILKELKKLEDQFYVKAVEVVTKNALRRKNKGTS